jgi:hypothetical protein
MFDLYGNTFNDILISSTMLIPATIITTWRLMKKKMQFLKGNGLNECNAF